MIRFFTTTLLLLVAIIHLSAQSTLLSEDFNSCSLPDGWTTTASGNPDAVWYAGNPDNENSDGSSVDGSCMLIFDDDATGNNTPAWETTIESPTFDGSSWENIRLAMDIHFRNVDGSASLQILINDGSNYHQIANYQGGGSQTGVQFSEYVTLTADLSFFSSPTMSLAIRYSDGDIWAWWAGVDNISIIGDGTATPVLLETFNDCNIPEGWETQIEAGGSGWQMGLVENENAEGVTSSMNGSCFAYFDDDGLGQDAVPSRVNLFSPVIDGTQYARFYLQFDLILRRFVDLENLSVGVQDVSTGSISWAATYLADMGGPQFYDYINEVLDLTNFRAPSMRLVFQYDDGGGWGWWVGIDNIKLTGEGEINDLCHQAIPVFLNGSCTTGDNTYALYTGPDANCSNSGIGSLWYRYEALQNGIVAIRTNAVYNDQLTLFGGSCDNPQILDCTNYDEFGFTGEELLFDAVAGQTYFIRVSGHRGSFGLPIGMHCIELKALNSYPTAPENDLCNNSIPLTVDGDCVEGNNYFASFEGPLPSLNNKSKADVWFQFESNDNTPLEITTNADFADVITLYKGACGVLEEVAGADRGQVLLVENTENTTYHLQISSYFATLFGNFCVSVKSIDTTAPENEICEEAVSVAVDGNCVAGNNLGATFSGPVSSCDVYLASGIWYSFVAPISGKAYLSTDADFVHSLSVFEGDCNNLEEVYCATNPNTCNGDAQINGLQPGNLYYVRISSTTDFTGTWENGNVCLSITEPLETNDFQPLAIGGNLECYGNGKAKLVYYVNGGTGNYNFTGNFNGEVLENGMTYIVVVTDDAGCSTSFAGTVDCEPTCSISAEVNVYGSNECPEDYLAAVEAEVSGGTEPYTYEWQNGSTSANLDGIASGYYTLTVTDADGNCSAIAGALVEGPLPYDFEVLSVTPSSGIDDGAVSVLFSGGTPPYEFSWWLEGALISEVQNPDNLLPGFYTFMVTDATGCTFEYENIEISITSSIDEVNTWLNYQLFPNPASNLINLKWQSNGSVVNQISILSIGGQLLLREQADVVRNAMVFDVSSFPAGCYFIRMQTNKGVETMPFIVGR